MRENVHICVAVTALLVTALLISMPAIAFAANQVMDPPEMELEDPELAAADGPDDAGLFPELKYYEAQSLFICPVHLPLNYDPAHRYPLVIGLHGYASSPERYHTLFYAFDDPQFIYAAPQAPYPLPMGSSLGFNWFLTDQNGKLLDESMRLSERYVLGLIHQLSADYSVGEVYLLGFSQGGALAYITGINQPDIFKGIICFASPFDVDWFDTPATIKQAADLHLFIAHATDDTAVEYQQGVQAAEQLEQLGFEVRFLPFEGGHTLTADALKEVEAWIENPPDAE